jgi:hypothetical protein
MKDNHKVIKVFVNFYRISTMLNPNDSSLSWKGYTAMLKRVKDKLVHFDKPRTLDELCDLIQKIDQRYWECLGKLARKTRSVPATNTEQDMST